MSSPSSDALVDVSSLVSEALVNNDLVYSEIMTYLSSAEIFRMAKVSSTVRASVGRGIPRIFNFHRHLSPYFPDTASLRSIQARTGAIIAGPVALQFFIRTPIPDVTPDACRVFSSIFMLRTIPGVSCATGSCSKVINSPPEVPIVILSPVSCFARVNRPIISMR